MKPWNREELAEIPLKGFQMLGVTATEAMIGRLVMECIDSPQTMQSICENIGGFLAADKKLTEKDISESCYLMADYLPYQELYARLLAGLPSRGQKRAIYYLEDGSAVDRYGLVLEALKRNPPLKSMALAEIYERAKKILAQAKEMQKLTARTIRDTINGMFSILEQSGDEADKVFDWKEQVLSFREPLFLFYLRWRRDE